MATTPITHDIKHIFRYQEARRTVFLHAANKDNYGRHRAHVLYGMKLHPGSTGTTIQIGPGAIHTGYGTKMFLDTIKPGIMQVDLADAVVSSLNNTKVLDPVNFGKRPLMVAIICKVHVYEGFNPLVDSTGNPQEDRTNPIPRAQQIETEADLKQPDLIEFTWRLVAWNRHTIQPTLNLLPQAPVFMTLGLQGGEVGAQEPYDYIKTYVPSEGSSPEAGTPTEYTYAETPASAEAGASPASGSLQFDEILLGYVIIGFPQFSTADISGDPPQSWTNVYSVPVPSNYVPSDLSVPVSDGRVWAPGVAVVQVKNAWESIEEVLGIDVLFGRNDMMMESWPDTGVSALSQTAGQFKLGHNGALNSQKYPLLLSPKFGTSKFDPQTGAYEPNWMNYRLPSFMKDGDDILWVMRRLDYLLRLWMDRTGDQTLVGQTQDGTAFDLGGGKYDFMPTLERILSKFDGGSSLTTNKNIITYQLASEDGALNPVDIVLKSGTLPHADAQATDINAILNTSMGDTHLGAIKALERCAWNILKYVIGVDAYRSWLRAIDNSNNPLNMFNDRPINLLNQPSAGNFTGSMVSAYLPDTATIVPAIRELVYRSERGPGTNLLINSSFWAVNVKSSSVLVGWNSNLSRALLAENSFCATGALLNGLSFGQTISLGGAVGGMLSSAGNIVSASVTLSNDGPLQLKIKALNESGGELSTASVDIPAGVSRTVSLSAYSVNTNARHLQFLLVNDSGGTVGVTVYGAALNAGMPNAEPVSRANMDFLSRWGGTEAAMFGDFYTGGNNIFTSSGFINTGGGYINTVGGWLSTEGGNIYTRVINTPPGAGQRNGGTIYTGGNQIHGETVQAEATALYDFVTLSQLKDVSIGGDGRRGDATIGGADYRQIAEEYTAQYQNLTIIESTAEGYRFPGITIIRARGNVVISGSIILGDPTGSPLGVYFSSLKYFPYMVDSSATPKGVWAPEPYMGRNRNGFGDYIHSCRMYVRFADHGDSFARDSNLINDAAWRPKRSKNGAYKERDMASYAVSHGACGGGGGGTGFGRRFMPGDGIDHTWDEPWTDGLGCIGSQGNNWARTTTGKYNGWPGMGIPGILYGHPACAFEVALGGRGGDGSSSKVNSVSKTISLGGLGGAGGGSFVLLADGNITVNPGVSVIASGWNGNPGASPAQEGDEYYGGSGGGGGGGQIILCSMKNINVSGSTLAVVGGSGAYTPGAGYGGGGGGGSIVLLAQGAINMTNTTFYYAGGVGPDQGEDGSLVFVEDYAVWQFPYGTKFRTP